MIFFFFFPFVHKQNKTKKKRLRSAFFREPISSVPEEFAKSFLCGFRKKNWCREEDGCFLSTQPNRLWWSRIRSVPSWTAQKQRNEQRTTTTRTKKREEDVQESSCSPFSVCFVFFFGFYPFVQFPRLIELERNPRLNHRLGHFHEEFPKDLFGFVVLLFILHVDAPPRTNRPKKNKQNSQKKKTQNKATFHSWLWLGRQKPQHPSAHGLKGLISTQHLQMGVTEGKHQLLG